MMARAVQTLRRRDVRRVRARACVCRKVRLCPARTQIDFALFTRDAGSHSRRQQPVVGRRDRPAGGWARRRWATARALIRREGAPLDAMTTPERLTLEAAPPCSRQPRLRMIN